LTLAETERYCQGLNSNSNPRSERGELDDDRVLELDSRVELFELDRCVIGVDGRGVFELADVDREGLRTTLALVDGKRTVREIVRALSARFPAAEVRALLEELEGTVLHKAPSTAAFTERSQRLATASVGILGGGRLARAIHDELAQHAFANLIAIEADAEKLGRSLSERALVICALEGVHGQAFVEVNRACLAANVPVLFVAIEADACVIGPLLVPRRTPCFVCSRLSTTWQSHVEEAGQKLVPRRWYAAVSTDALPWWLARIAFETRTEAERALLGSGYPRHLHSLLFLEPSGETQTVPIEAVTTCSECRGHHRGELLDASAAPRPSPSFERHPASARVDICDDTGGTRTVSAEEARRRAQVAFEVLGVDLECVPLGADAPEEHAALACPFYRTRTSVRFDAGSPVLFNRHEEPCYGKGTTELQARCSASFEWFERNLSQWRGDHNLVRASYAEVREQAIDVPFLASGRLPGFTLPGRRPFDPDEPIDWVWGQCLRTHRPILVPASSVFLDQTRFLGSDFELPRAGSSGLSAGCSVADAVLQGLLEIVERDATFTALRNGVVHPPIAVDSVDEPAARGLLDRMVRAGFVPHMRETTSAIEIPTIEVYVVREGEYGNHFAMGYGAHLDRGIALRRAVTEAAQSLFGGAAMGIAEPIRAESSYFEVFPYRHQVLERKGERPPADETGEAHAMRATDVWAQIDLVVARIRAGIPEADVCAVDISLPALAGVHVVRTLVTGAFDEARPVQIHIPERCRIAGLDRMFLGRVSM
jgi:oxazoline/thiazoline synthase